MQQFANFSRSCCIKLRSEFQIQNLGLTIFPQNLAWVYQFGEFSWTTYRLAYVIWRAILSCTMLVGFGLSLSKDIIDSIGAWYPIYLTNWTLFIENCYLILAFVIALGIYLSPPISESRQPLSTKVAWLLRSIGQPGALVVTIAYWSVVSQGTPSLSTIWVHAINSIVVCLDIITSCYEIRLAHYLYLLIYGVIYVVWSIIHYQANIRNGPPPSQRYIYAALDWSAQNAGKVGTVPCNRTIHANNTSSADARHGDCCD
jgi:hypothetical protein